MIDQSETYVDGVEDDVDDIDKLGTTTESVMSSHHDWHNQLTGLNT